MSDLWNANLLNGINMTEEKEVLEKSMNTKTKKQVPKGKPSITSVQNCATRYTIVPSMLYNYIKHIVVWEEKGAISARRLRRCHLGSARKKVPSRGTRFLTIFNSMNNALQFII